MKEALTSLYGNHYSFYSNRSDKVTAVGSGRYSLNNPIKPDGTLTKYARLTMLVAKNPGLTRVDILERLGDVDRGRSFICSTFQALIAGGLIEYRRIGNKHLYFSGSFFDTWKQNYLKA